ncbi:DMT family transporter [Rhizorhabdus dicambivorans]|uniref:EamA/RhaT family transporter n=1 Tax=Rhizorhabdus dicambivorans TaxID=1850238 RepID=A0A2A4G014_9SPHN|nr:DMT family transporter [Rhizorhabdus dicambivorans]ATE66575.1 EamA/RhaT family transporter [Rhizorhabdus dicambivorans]PCE44052.1 EamA/RhaT family transporter [Rhizorhabdus dicambivorans]
MPEPATMHRESQISRGILLRCLAVICFSIMSAAMKWASEDGVAEIEMLFFRSTIGLPVVLAWLALGPGIGVVRTQRPRAHLIRSMIGIIAILLNFGALIRLPLADAVTIGFTAPIFATILSVLLLGEKVGVQRWFAVALGFVGVALIVRPGGMMLDHLGLLMAIGGAVGTAGVTVTIRQLGATEHPGAIVLWFFLASSLVSGVGMLFVAQPHSASAWMALIVAGVAGAGAQVAMTSSLHAAPVSVIAPFDYLQIIWATLIGWLVWTALPDANILLGAALIAASGLYTAWREHRLRRERIAATPPLE